MGTSLTNRLYTIDLIYIYVALADALQTALPVIIFLTLHW